MNPGDNGRNDSLIFDKFSFCTFKKKYVYKYTLKIIETYSVSLCTSYSGNEAVTVIKVFSV